jgi:hypothetical protein
MLIHRRTNRVRRAVGNLRFATSGKSEIFWDFGEAEDLARRERATRHRQTNRVYRAVIHFAHDDRASARRSGAIKPARDSLKKQNYI